MNRNQIRMRLRKRRSRRRLREARELRDFELLLRGLFTGTRHAGKRRDR